MQCNGALIICRLASQLHVGIATFDVTTQRTCSAGCTVNAVTRSLKLTAQSRAVRIWMIKIGFNKAADLIRIRSIKIGFDPNSVLESVRTLLPSKFYVNQFGSFWATFLTDKQRRLHNLLGRGNNVPFVRCMLWQPVIVFLIQCNWLLCLNGHD